MSHTLADFPARRAPSGRTADAPPDKSRSYKVDELGTAPSRTQNRRYIVRTFILAPALVGLAVYAVVKMPEIMAQTGDLLGGTSSSAHSSSLLAAAAQWLPVLLVMLSAAVLACMGFLTLRGRSRTQKSKGPQLLPASAQPAPMENATRELAIVPRSTPPGKPFLVERSELRHAAQEEIRLSRDARASAEQRAAAVSRLRITAAAPAFRQGEAPEPALRLRTLPRRSDLLHGKRRPGFAAALDRPLTEQSGITPASQPPRIA